MDIAQLIRDESVKYRALHERVHETCQRRHVDHASQEAWRQACKAFHAFRSSLAPLFERAPPCSNSTMRRPISQYVAVIAALILRATARRAVSSNATMAA
jgi:hypothetical protein